MQKKEWHRNVIVGIIVGAIFFGWWLRGFLYTNWHFQLFSKRSWTFVAHEFESGWMLNAKSDWIFLITLLLSVPVFLYLWYLCAKIRWRKLIKKLWKWIVALFVAIFATKAVKKYKNKKKTKVLAPPPPAVVIHSSSSSARPKPIGHATPAINFQTASAMDSTYSAAPTFDVSATSTNRFSSPGLAENKPWQSTELGNNDIADIPLEDIQLPEREPVVEDIPALFTQAGYQLIEQVKMPLQTLDYLAVSADTVYAVLVDKEPGDWLAEEEPFNGEAPLWFSEVDHRVSPVYELNQTVAEMKKKVVAKYPDMKVQAFMIEQKGNIINAEEMLRIWQELNVVVTRTDIGGTEDLPVTARVIKTVQSASAAQIEELTKMFKGDK